MGRSLSAAFVCGMAAVLVSLPALGQKAPAPAPRLGQLVNTIVIAEINRSVLFERTLPQPAASERRKPAVNEPDMVRAGDGLYIERSLVPRSAMTDDEGAVRVFPRDAR